MRWTRLEPLRLQRQRALLDAHLYAQKALLHRQSVVLTERVRERLRSPWAVAAAFGLGLLAGWPRRRARRRLTPVRALAVAERLRTRMLRAWPVLRALAALYAASRGGTG